MSSDRRYDAVVFDLLTALIDSWSLWNSVAGSEEAGLRWRKAYLELTYGAGAYRPYEAIVAEAATIAGLPDSAAGDLSARWGELSPWPEVRSVLAQLARDVPLAIVTNCSERLGQAAARSVFDRFSVVVTAEAAGYYKPRPEPYTKAIEALRIPAERILFVAGSAADVPGASALGMTVYWHNRIGLVPRDGASPAYLESTLDLLPGVVRQG